MAEATVRPRVFAAGSGMAVVATLLSGSVAHAQAPVFEVDTLSDDGSLNACTAADNDCSLRGAIDAANGAGGGTITFASGVTGTITLGSELPYISAGETIQGPGADLLTIDAAGVSTIAVAVDSGSAVSISGLTLSHAPDGALYHRRGAGPLSLSGVALVDNYLGIDSGGGALTISGSTVSGSGVGVWEDGASLTMEKSTVSGNTAGVRVDTTGTIENSTVGGNNFGVEAYGGNLTLDSTVVGDNTHDVTFSAGVTLTESYSLIQNPSGLPAGFDAGHNLNGQDPQLGPLADHGGPTKTMAPAFSSPVVDQGKDFTGTGVDQRGIAIVDQPGVDNAADGRDIGAFELRLPPVVSSLAPDHGNAGATVTITGSHFTGTTSVKFGSKEATSFTVDSDTQITAYAPPGNNGPVDVTVTADSTSDTSTADQFTYPTFVVDTTDDDGSLTNCTPAPNDCSLRGAINGANASEGSTITFASGVTGTIALGSDLPEISAGETIEGPGVDVLTLDGNGHHASVYTRTSDAASISGLTLTGVSGGLGVNGIAILHLADMAISGNSGYGVHAFAPMDVKRSTVSGNSGRGVYATGLTMQNSTVSGNAGYGVAVNGNTTIENSTIAANGGGARVSSGSSTGLTLRSTIIAGNTSPDVRLPYGAKLTENFSLVQNTTYLPSSLEAGSGDNLNGQDPKLGALADNGGPTKTMKPAADSPVVDKGNDYTGTGKDQRGLDLFDRTDVPNAADGRDMGAVELQPPNVDSLSPDHGPTGTEITITGTNFTAATAVKFGTHDATSFTVVDDTHITAIAPAGYRTRVDVTVTSPDGTSEIGGSDQFAYPGTFDVDTTDDNGSLTACTSAPDDCSLRGAITGADDLPGSTITFASGLTGTITLGSNLPYLTAGETIEGPGAGVLAIDGAAHYYGFSVRTGRGPVSISGLTVKNGSGFAGAVYASGSEQMTLSGMTVSGNTGNYHGAIAAYAPTVIEDSTISGNQSSNGFGAVASSRSTLTLRNSTVSGNPSGGLYVGRNTTAMIENSTIAANAAGGIKERSTGDLRLRSSIVAGNSSFDVSVASGGKVTENFSLVQNGSGLPATLQSGSGDNLNGSDPKLGALANNGGPTKTMKPAADSPVVDKGHDYAGTGKDQRGLGITGAARDIGAVELQQPSVTSLSAGSGNAGDSVTITGTNFTGATGVKFGAVDATDVVVVDATHITAKAPAGSGTVDVTVTTADGTSTASASDRFRYLAPPTVSSLSPATGNPGDTVTIAGANFTGATGVKFGTADAIGVTVVSATQITAKAPAGSGTVDVTVTTSDGTSATSAGDKFTYAVTPNPPPAGLSDNDVLKLLKRPVLSSKFVAKKRTLVFKDRLPEAGKATYTLRVLHKRKQLKLGSATVTATGARTATVTIKLGKKNWSVLRLNPKGKLSLVTSFTRKLNGHTLNVTRTIKPKNRPKH